MENLWQDLRFGVRTLLRNRPTSLLALLVLTLGIGANTAIFSVISGVLLTPHPHKPREPLEVLAIRQAIGLTNVGYPPVVNHEYRPPSRHPARPPYG